MAVLEARQLQTNGEPLPYTAAAAYTGGTLIQLSDGRAAVVHSDVASGALCAPTAVGTFILPKTADIVMLDGGGAFWDHSANKINFKEVNDRDFYAGTVVGDTLGSASYVIINLNAKPRYLVDLARDAYITVPVGTSAAGGFGVPSREGGSLKFNITATSEAQKADALSVQGFNVLTSNPIVEGAFRIGAAGSGSASDYTLGIADASHASNADTITSSCFIHLDGASTTINAESDNAAAEVAATDTTKVFAAGTDIAKRVEFWMDCRDPADIQIYIEGILVLGSTVFTLGGIASPTMYLLAHLEKSTGTETAEMTVDWLRCRTSEQ